MRQPFIKNTIFNLHLFKRLTLMSSANYEVLEHIQHRDYSLAIRRLLDMSYDSGNLSIIREATDWSRKWNEQLNNKPDAELAEDFSETAHALLQKSIAEIEKKDHEPTALLDAVQISKTYTKGNFRLNPINISIKSGDILGVVGENGNGKTTLLRCLAGQLFPDSGNVHYQLLSNPDYYNIKNYVAFIPQRIPRWYGKLKDNLHFSASIAGIHGNANDVMVEFMLERLNLSRYAELTWTQISSGYRTRFEIARILLQKPQLLILDEPLANLDIKAQQTILTDLKYITAWRNHPMGVILSSQQLHEVEKVAHKVLMIKNGSCINGDELKTEATNFTAVLEIETKASREELLEVLGNDVDVKYNGGFYTISSSAENVQMLIAKLLSRGITISYFRDISKSTKRFF